MMSAPCIEHVERVGDGCVDVEVLAAVGEGVGGDVEDAHDARARKRDLVRPALPDCVSLFEHGGKAFLGATGAER